MITPTTTSERSVDALARLQDRYWPPVKPFAGLGQDLCRFIHLDPARQAAFLTEARAHGREMSSTVHEYLAEIYAYVFGYRDGACSVREDDDLETTLAQSKILLERELIDHCLDVSPIPSSIATQGSASRHLTDIAAGNPGVDHALFEFLEKDASPTAMETFLTCEVVRNEVVDDEVAMLVVGLQGKLKAAAASNLWDECGHGKLQHFHTFWLRRFLEATGGWERIGEYRARELPWFARITSNVNAMLLSRPSYRFMAYGCFHMFESWVAPHFRRVLRGMERLGIEGVDARLYFDAHVSIDPLHSAQLVDGVRLQRPALSAAEVAQILRGAHIGIAAGVAQFDRMLPYLQSLS